MLVVTGLLIRSLAAEEKTILTGNSNSQYDTDPNWTFNANALTDGGLKSMIHTTGTDVVADGGSKEVRTTLAEPKTVLEFFVGNRSVNYAY